MITEYFEDDYEWDDQKNAANKQKHGIAFEMAVQIFSDVYIEGPSHGEHEEQRMVAIG